MKQKLFGTVLTLSLAFSVLPSVSYAQDNNMVMVNGEQVKINSIMEDDRLLVPLNGIFEKLGAEVKWNKEKSEIIIEDGYTLLDLYIDRKEALVYKKFDFTGIPMKSDLDVTPRVIDNTVYVPLRFVAESINASVEWDNDSNEVSITSKKVNKTIAYDLVSQEEIQNCPELLKWFDNNKVNKGIYFTKESDSTYVMISGGMVTTGGYTVNLNGIVQNTPENICIYASIETPSDDLFVTQVISYPTMIIKIKNTDIKNVNGTIY